MAGNLVISSSQFSSNVDENQFEPASTAEKRDFLDDGDVIEFYDLEKCVECIKNCDIETPKVRTSNQMYRVSLLAMKSKQLLKK
jgi:hypothetical protein